MDFRTHTPHRRNNPTLVKRSSDAKPELREDFHCRCGYCDDHDFFKETYYEVDHFVPKGMLKTISPIDYKNMVYSCRSCNNEKRAKWPTKDENKHNDGKTGFVDPCNEEYSKQFERLFDGAIVPVTDLGRWMWDAMKLYNPSHHIIWQLEQLRKNLTYLLKYSDKCGNDPTISSLIIKISKEYFEYEKQLKGTPVF